MYINCGIASAKKYSGRLPFVSSFRLSVRWIWATYTNFRTLCYRKKILIGCQKGINEIQKLCGGFQAVVIIMICYVVPCWLNDLGFNLINLCSNLVHDWACNIQHGPLLQHTSFKMPFVRSSNAMDRMLFCCIVVFQYVSIICQGGASANPFETGRVALLTISTMLALIDGCLFQMQSSRSLHIANTRCIMSEWPNRWILWLPETIDRGVDTVRGSNCHCLCPWFFR